ncbi:DUF2911 domain-containing protein [Mucilaginibacter ginsenosidivorax]|uniref:DUF2911 domain-containing protein n=1 Tax=Mucilaginibacter ginsenosidivorax TaxID=862126 RepID=A0A5B8VVZ5_9SPHI|nr:DUF2911 domain-containing protein [Mucilaginibacter ginsenosidivorax]QEC75052.1 DUF2911 domain-containing protein [Mucilaginibacter ginsenosidivorax]
MRIKIFFGGLLLHLCILASAQQPHRFKGSLTYTLGPDTTATGNFDLNGNEFALTIVSMSPGVNVSKLKGIFFSDGQLMRLQGFNYDPAKGQDSLIYAYTLTYARDTTFIETKSPTRSSIRKYPVKIMETNAFGGDVLVFMPALLAHFAPKKIGDSVLSSHIAFNSARKFMIKKTDSQKLQLGSAVMGMFTILLDKNGGIQAVDGIGTSFNIKGKAGAYLNIDSVIAANVNHQRQHSRLAIINKLDSVKATINGVDIKIEYSRPSVRGRVIFGEVVPWNRIWRTGADAATKIYLNKPLYFSGKELPTGAYSIFTIPTPTGFTLIFNKQANIWGTEHNADYDFLKIPMQMQTLNRPAELLTFEIVTAGANGGVISFSWDKLKASAGFTTQA